MEKRGWGLDPIGEGGGIFKFPMKNNILLTVVDSLPLRGASASHQITTQTGYGQMKPFGRGNRHANCVPLALQLIFLEGEGLESTVANRNWPQMSYGLILKNLLNKKRGGKCGPIKG